MCLTKGRYLYTGTGGDVHMDTGIGVGVHQPMRSSTVGPLY